MGNSSRPSGVKRIAIVAVVLLVAAAMVIASQASAAGGITVTHTVTNSWSSGYQAAIKIRNDSTQTVRNWRLDFSLPHQISSLWNGKLVSQQGSAVKVAAPDWDPDLSPGETVEIGYVANVSGYNSASAFTTPDPSCAGTVKPARIPLLRSSRTGMDLRDARNSPGKRVFSIAQHGIQMPRLQDRDNRHW